jgi:hypothetical protein
LEWQPAQLRPAIGDPLASLRCSFSWLSSACSGERRRGEIVNEFGFGMGRYL